MSDSLQAKFKLLDIFEKIGFEPEAELKNQLLFLKGLIESTGVVDDEVVEKEIQNILDVVISNYATYIEARYDDYFNRIVTYYIKPYMEYINSLLIVTSDAEFDGGVRFSKNAANVAMLEKDKSCSKIISEYLVSQDKKITSTKLSERISKVGIDKLAVPEIRPLLINILRIIEEERQILVGLTTNRRITLEVLETQTEELNTLEELIGPCCDFLKQRCITGNEIAEAMKKL